MGKALLLYGSGSSADILYATGFYTVDPFPFIETGSKRFLLLSDLEMGRGKRTARARVLSYSYYQKTAQKRYKKITPAEVMACALEKLRIKQVELSRDFPYSYAVRLKQLGFSLSVKSGIFRREIKYGSEIEKIRKTQRCAENAMEHAIDIISGAKIKNNKLLIKGRGLTSEYVRACVQKRLIELGCACPEGVIVSCGCQSAFPHESGSGALRPNKPIVIDIFPRSEKSFYWGDITRTVVRGRPDRKLKEIFGTVLDAQNLCLELIRHNVPAKNIHKLVAELFDKNGFRNIRTKQANFGFIHGLGHGVGLEIHEKPRISDDSEDILQKGNVVTAEPGLYYPRIGGVRIEDLVAVTQKGCRNLTKFDRFITV